MKLIHLFLILAVLGIGAGVFFFITSLGLQKGLSQAEESYRALKDEHTKLEAELVILKNRDLAKEVELLTLKLKTAENSLSASEKEVLRLQSRVGILETNLGKIKPYLSAIDAVQRVVLGDTGPTRSVVAGADPKVSVLKDAQITNIWEEAKRNIDFEKLSWQQQYFGNTISMIISRIFTILP